MCKAKQLLGLLEGNLLQRWGQASQFAMSPAEPWDQARRKAKGRKQAVIIIAQVKKNKLSSKKEQISWVL